MRTLQKLAVAGLAALAAGLAWSPLAAAHGGARLGFYFGGPVWGPYPYGWYGYPPPYVVERRPIVIQQEPPVYVQQPPPQQQPANYWYYCPDQGYYPYVQACPKGWLQVAPQPAPGAPR